MRSWKEGLNFHDEILTDKEITGKVPRKQIEYAFDLQRQLKNVDKIFARVFGKKRSAKPTSTANKTKKIQKKKR
jgi:adenylosuccinate lyase